MNEKQIRFNLFIFPFLLFLSVALRALCGVKFVLMSIALGFYQKSWILRQNYYNLVFLTVYYE